MSRWVKTQVEIKSLSIMTKVCEMFGLKIQGRQPLHETSQVYDITDMQYGYPRNIARLEPRLDQSGTFDLWMESAFQRISGKNANEFQRTYAEEAVKFEADKHGWRIEDREVQPDGSLVFELNAVNW